MKTLESAKAQVSALQVRFSIAQNPKEKRELNRDFLKLKPLLLILQSGANEQSLRKQLEQEERKLEIISKRVSEMVAELSRGGGYSADLQKRLEAEYNVKDIKSRIELLREILN